MNDERFEKLKKGDIECVEEGLVSECVTERINAIISVVKYNIKDDVVIGLVRNLASDHERVYNQNPDMTISNFSIAALDILNVEKYAGEDAFVKKLVQKRLGLV